MKDDRYEEQGDEGEERANEEEEEVARILLSWNGGTGKCGGSVEGGGG